ncbi:hypothetical protein GJ496_008065 [Pomphorhynchus laevis]|nr:hypothetical protein GJ496_008065 [Pomphorhynchus laevis]
MHQSLLVPKARNIDTFGAFSEDATKDERCRWIRIYAAYLNKNRTRFQGRRVSRKEALDNPTCADIKDVLQHASFEVLVQQRVRLPRHLSGTRPILTDDSGRVLVRLFNADGTPVHQYLKNKTRLLYFLCEHIPRLKSRQSTLSTKVTSNQTDHFSSSSKKKR